MVTQVCGLQGLPQLLSGSKLPVANLSLSGCSLQGSQVPAEVEPTPRRRLTLPDLMHSRGIPFCGGGVPDGHELGAGVRVLLTCLRIPAGLWISP